MLVGALEVRAATITIDKAETLTNGGQTLTETGGDTITVTETGSITTEGGTRRAPRWAISAFTDSNTIKNAGKINTKGTRADGIRTRNNNEITNSGSINTKGKDAEGIFALANSTITNEVGGSINTKGEHAEGILVRHANTITNEAGGSINTKGKRADGISAYSNNTITNSGSISTEGGYADGIWATSNNTITNSGSISTEGEYADGIDINNIRNTITNEAGGSISTKGRYATGIRVGDEGNTITNAGLITTTGAGASGIWASYKGKITHSGRIQVSGPGSAGIWATSGNELTLSGSITSAQGSALHLGNNNTVYHCRCGALTSSGENTPAVRLGSNNTLSNRGTIEATGTGAEAHAITGNSGNTINNDGIIKANPAGAGKAIAFTGRNNTLNLGPNSRITGDIDLGTDGRQNRVAKIDDAPCGEACRSRDKQKRVKEVVDPNPVKPDPVKPNQVRVSQAPAISMLWDGITARPVKGSEGAPFFYNAQTRQLATYDIRALAASAQALGDAGNVSRLMARPALRPSGNTRSLIPTASGSALWLRTFGNRARYRSRGNLDPEAGHLGLAAGYDLRLNATQFGVLAGYGRGELRFEGAERFKPGPSLFKGPFAGVYVRQDFAPFSLQLGLAGGALRHASSRLINDSLAPNGLARAEARTRSWWLAPEARVGLRLDAGLMQFEPAFTARYTRQSIRGFSETGIRAPATVGRRTVELVETRLELKAGREVGPGRIALKAGWQYRDDLDSSQARVRMLGESQRVRLESGLGSSFYLGAEAEFELAPGLFLNLSGEAVSGSGYRSMSGMATVYQAF